MSGPGQIQQLFEKATALYHSGEYHQAIQAWQELLQIDPNNHKAKEGIRMAALLLEEAQLSAESQSSAATESNPESSEIIARVREGIQKVRECLAASRHLDAIEVCQALLQLAPRSQAVREILEEAREAYEAQPFIAEHLEIARQLFVQERLEEASAELQKIYFLNPNHAEARKLEAKILALREKRSPVSTPPVHAPDAPEGTVAPAEARASDTQRIRIGPETEHPEEGAPALPASEPPAIDRAPEGASASDQPVLNADWEAELAHLDVGASQSTPTGGPEKAEAGPEEDRIPLADLSEPFQAVAPMSSRVETPPAAKETPEAVEAPIPELDLSTLGEDLLAETRAAGRGSSTGARPAGASRLRKPAPARRSAPIQTVAPRRSGARWAVPLLFLLAAGGGAWWLLGMRGLTLSGGGGGAGSSSQAPLIPRRAPSVPGAGGNANPGLSSSGSRTNGATKAAVDAAAPLVAPPEVAPQLSPEEIHREVARLSAEARSQLSRGSYIDAVQTFAKILDLDPANVEIKEQMDQAATKVQEQRKLEDDVKTAKDFFMEKDYESALRKLYRLPRDRNLGDLDLFTRNAWYNWAVVSMKGGNCAEALHRLDEVLAVDSGDPDAVKQKEVAEHYRDRPKDRVYYAYVDRLTYRTLNQR